MRAWVSLVPPVRGKAHFCILSPGYSHPIAERSDWTTRFSLMPTKTGPQRCEISDTFDKNLFSFHTCRYRTIFDSHRNTVHNHHNTGMTSWFPHCNSPHFCLENRTHCREERSNVWHLPERYSLLPNISCWTSPWHLSMRRAVRPSFPFFSPANRILH